MNRLSRLHRTYCALGRQTIGWLNGNCACDAIVISPSGLSLADAYECDDVAASGSDDH